MVLAITPVETVRLDRDRIVELGMRLGPIAAEDLISRTMEDLAVLLAQVSRAYDAHDLDAVIGYAKRIGEQAQHIGMTKLARVAGDVLTLASRADAAALAAVVRRLARLGEKSLMAVWDLQQNSI